ncbi:MULTISPECIES: NrfD/PsrC family molybdoenzyme membrane anchor subunit [unclassified Campylobacter]|uniref:NrfD/PsrC family molybdoenzyme membrane anchor subunit n=1 Tax=unclassified Campylobacter TaxID=2593542 RepID=UPI003D345BDC
MNNMWGSMAQYGEIYWPWPIALYLFLAGLSAGAAIVAVLLKWQGKTGANFKSAVLLAPIAIIVGLALLVLDLGKPLSFYWILLKYNFTSVMSIGVALLLVYTPIVVVYALFAYKDLAILAPFKGLISSLEKALAKLCEILILPLAIGVGVYTGFLLSAVSKILLWDTPILPILFLVSGLSSGIAASVLCGAIFGKEKDESTFKLLKLDMFVIIVECLLLVALFGYLYSSGSAGAEVAGKALTNGALAVMFWVFVVGSGMALPVVIELANGEKMSKNLIIFNTFIVILGVILLRYYIVYAGQM